MSYRSDNRIPDFFLKIPLELMGLEMIGNLEHHICPFSPEVIK